MFKRYLLCFFLVVRFFFTPSSGPDIRRKDDSTNFPSLDPQPKRPSSVVPGGGQVRKLQLPSKCCLYSPGSNQPQAQTYIQCFPFQNSVQLADDEDCPPSDYLQDYENTCNVTISYHANFGQCQASETYPAQDSKREASLVSLCLSFAFLSDTNIRKFFMSTVRDLAGILSPKTILKIAMEGKGIITKASSIIGRRENEIEQEKLIRQTTLPGLKRDYLNKMAYDAGMLTNSKFLWLDLGKETSGRPKSKINLKARLAETCWKSWIGSFRPTRPQVVTAYPAFLPSAGSSPAEMMSFSGYRLGSLSSLPARCNVSRVRLAEAGFYYDHSKPDRDQTNDTELVCYSCGLKYGQWKNGDNPLDIHRALNPGCHHLQTLPGNPARTSTASLALASGVTLPENVHPSWSSSPASVDSAYSSGTPDSFPHQHFGLQPSLSSDHGYHSAHSHGSGFSSSRGNDSGFSSSIHLSSSGWSNSKYISNDLATDSSAIAPSPVEQATAETAASQSSTNTSQLGSFDNQRGAKSAPMEDLPPLDMRSAVYPQFSLTHDRKATFVNWPLGHLFHPDVLILQGFYYAGYADCIRCFYCGVGLKSWDKSDDVMKEHIRWRPSCGYILSTKGRHFVDKVLEELNMKTNAQNGNFHDSTVQAVTAPTASNAPVASNPYHPSVTTISSSSNNNNNGSVNAPRAAPRPASGASVAGAVSSAAPGASGTASSSPSPSPPPTTGGDARREVLRKVEEMGFSTEDIARAFRLLQSQGQTKISADQLVQTILDLPPVDTTPAPRPSVTTTTTTTTTKDTLQTDSEPTTQRRSSGASRQPEVELDLAQRLVLENEQLRSRQTCKLCRQAKVGMIFMPCGHVLACTACGSKTRHCTLCGQFIRATANIYLS